MAKKSDKIPAVLKDFTGKEIKPGDIVAYGKALGRCAGLNVGVVLDVYQLENYRNNFDDRVSILTNQDSWTDFADRDPNKAKYSFTSAMKKVTLLFSDRLIVIDEAALGKSELADVFREESKKIKEKLAGN